MSGYRFNNLTGRVVKAAESFGQFKAVKESPELIFATPVKFAKAPLQYVKPGRGGFGAVSPQLLAKYRHYQINDGTPIHLKGGPADKILYYATILLCAVGLEECFRLYYTMGFPKKPEE